MLAATFLMRKLSALPLRLMGNTMIRFVSGIILTAFATFTLVVALFDDVSDGLDFYVGLVIFAVPGILLIIFGKRAIALRKHVLEQAFAMLRQADGIDARAISASVGVSEIKVRGVLAREQRKGVIPTKADIT